MKHLIYAVGLLAALTFAHCKTKQKITETATVSPIPAPTKSAGTLQMEIAETRWPGTVAEEIKEGQVIFTTKCTHCHKAYAIEGFSEKKWLHEIDDMSPKAKLSPQEKLRLTKYVLSYRETKEKMKGM